MGRGLYKAFGGLWVCAGFLKLAHDCFNLAAPYFLRRLLQHIQSTDKKERLEGLFWALGLFGCGFMVAILITQHFVRIFKARAPASTAVDRQT